MQVGIARALEHVTDARSREEQPLGLEHLDTEHSETLVEKNRLDGEAHPERVDRAGPKEQQGVMRFEPVPSHEPADPLAPMGGNLHTPPRAAGVSKNDLPHVAER